MDGQTDGQMDMERQQRPRLRVAFCGYTPLPPVNITSEIEQY